MLVPAEPAARNWSRRAEPDPWRLLSFDLRDGRPLGGASLPDDSRGPVAALEPIGQRRLAVYDYTWSGAERYEVDLATGEVGDRPEDALRVEPQVAEQWRRVAERQRGCWLSFEKLPGSVGRPFSSSTTGEYAWSTRLPLGGWVGELRAPLPLTLRFRLLAGGYREVVLGSRQPVALGPQLPSGELLVATATSGGRSLRDPGAEAHRTARWILRRVDPEAGAARPVAEERFAGGAARPHGLGPVLLLESGAPLLLLDPAGGLEAIDLESGKRRRVVMGRLDRRPPPVRTWETALLGLARAWRGAGEALRHPLASNTV